MDLGVSEYIFCTQSRHIHVVVLVAVIGQVIGIMRVEIVVVVSISSLY